VFNLSKVRVNTFVMLQKIPMSKKAVRLNFLFHKGFWKIIRNVSWSPNEHIRMISEGSCDSEDWSNDAEHSALPSQE